MIGELGRRCCKNCGATLYIGKTDRGKQFCDIICSQEYHQTIRNMSDKQYKMLAKLRSNEEHSGWLECKVDKSLAALRKRVKLPIEVAWWSDEAGIAIVRLSEHGRYVLREYEAWLSIKESA